MRRRAWLFIDSVSVLPKAVVIGIAPSSGSIAGGTGVVIEVDDSTGATAAHIGGVSLLSFTIDDATHVSGITQANTAGASDVTVTNGGGISNPLVGGFTYTPPLYDPAIDVATGWWVTPYTVGSMPALTSAGTSGTAGNLTDGAGPPVGIIGGENGADFSAHKLGNASAISTFISDSSYSVEAVFTTRTNYPRAVGAAYSEPAFISDDANGFFYFTRSSGAVVLGHYDGVAFREIVAACPTDSNILVAQGWFVSGELHLVIDGITTPAPVAAGLVYATGGAGLLRTGANYTNANSMDGIIGELRVANVDHGPTARAGYLTYVNDKFGTSF